MMKQDIFCELVEGVEALAAQVNAVALPVLAVKPGTKRIGAMTGKWIVPEDFDSPLPDELIDAFE